MIVRNLHDPEVQGTTYRAHRGGIARMLMTSRFLQGIEFLAHAMLAPGNALEEHVDPVEEIYYILKGAGIMQVDGETEHVSEGDAIWIPSGAAHAFTNHLDEFAEILVIAAYPRVR